MKKGEIEHTVTMKKAIDGLKLQVTLPICSDECDLAFDLKQLFIKNPDLDTIDVMTRFWISSELSNEDIKIAINTLIENEEGPLKQNLSEYLEYAKLHHLYED
jgi:hypothetical protein